MELDFFFKTTFNLKNNTNYDFKLKALATDH